jgi:hypothetical protein
MWFGEEERELYAVGLRRLVFFELGLRRLVS